MARLLSRVRRSLSALGIAGLAATLAGGASAGTMKLGMTTWVGYGPLFLARDLGYFKEGGLEISMEIIEESALYMAAVASGRLDGMASTVDEVMKYRSPAVCFKGIYALDDSHGGDGVLAPTGIKSVADLKGKEVGLNEGSVSQFWFNILLKQAGLTESDVTITNMTADDAATAFMAGRIPVAVTWEPHLTLARSAGKGQVLIDSSKTPAVIVDIVGLRCDYIEKHPDDVRTLVNGLNKAAEFIRTNPEKAYAIMAKGVGGWLKDPKDFASSAAGVTFYGKSRNAAFFADGNEGEAGRLVKLGGEIWGRLGKLKMDIKYDDLLDPRFLQQ